MEMTNPIAVPRVPTRLLNTPLLVADTEVDALRAALSGRLTPADLLALFPGEPRPEPAEDPRIAVIRVTGGLAHRGYGWYWRTSYEQIRKNFRAALADPAVEAIVFDVNSPGGEVAGCFDLVDEIFAAREEKKIYAVANEACCSGAYAIASAAHTLYIPRTGAVGSIGVRALHIDQSGWDKEIGVTYTAIYAGARKNDGSPHEPLSDPARAAIQATVDRAYKLFCDTVARNRGLTPKKIRDTEAAVFEGEAAVTAGLADAVLSWDRALETIAAQLEQGGTPMSMENIRTELAARLADPAQQKDARALLAALGYAPAAEPPAPAAETQTPPPAAETQTQAPQAAEAPTPEALAAQLAEAREEGRQAGIAETTARAVEIIGVCDLAGATAMAPGLITDGVTADDARNRVVAARATADQATQILSTTSPVTTGEVSPVIADAQRRANGGAQAA